ncbi:hypothetical protein DPMN_055821 [Dreissena polymorpha]|uniref:Uncharacterized protein n=1 Tax=Dreissena polymorpha TaxID=45954 RepID=A0A9D4CQM2_DREPO|nr:hypothetical protein DPMN_055821 [Dreissena polymorpha]
MRPAGKRGGAAGAPGQRRRPNLDEADEDVYRPRKQEVDPSYSDPLGPQMERPKLLRQNDATLDDDFADEELGEGFVARIDLTG